MTLKFVGSSISLVGTKDSYGGYLSISLDSSTPYQANRYSSSTIYDPSCNNVLYTQGGLSTAQGVTHTITVNHTSDLNGRTFGGDEMGDAFFEWQYLEYSPPAGKSTSVAAIAGGVGGGVGVLIVAASLICFFAARRRNKKRVGLGDSSSSSGVLPTTLVEPIPFKIEPQSGSNRLSRPPSMNAATTAVQGMGGFESDKKVLMRRTSGAEDRNWPWPSGPAGPGTGTARPSHYTNHNRPPIVVRNSGVYAPGTGPAAILPHHGPTPTPSRRNSATFTTPPVTRPQAGVASRRNSFGAPENSAPRETRSRRNSEVTTSAVAATQVRAPIPAMTTAPQAAEVVLSPITKAPLDTVTASGSSESGGQEKSSRQTHEKSGKARTRTHSNSSIPPPAPLDLKPPAPPSRDNVSRPPISAAVSGRNVLRRRSLSKEREAFLRTPLPLLSDGTTGNQEFNPYASDYVPSSPLSTSDHGTAVMSSSSNGRGRSDEKATLRPAVSTPTPSGTTDPPSTISSPRSPSTSPLPALPPGAGPSRAPTLVGHQDLVSRLSGAPLSEPDLDRLAARVASMIQDNRSSGVDTPPPEYSR
ncbi:hypothetical protein FRB99_005781 [Tulasnella sp. 403]|nr:hypothetical protein FRB99_005781 [Tulasnella sp. 403]